MNTFFPKPMATLLILVAAAVCMSASCASTGTQEASLPVAEKPAGAAMDGRSAQVRDTVLATLTQLAGKPYNSPATVGGKAFKLDCIGLVSAAFWSGGVDLSKGASSFGGNGVSRLWSLLDSRGVHDSTQWPRPGDIAFWDNTWDANEDGRFGNDGHTHAGIVSRVDAEGTVWYWHASVSRGVVEAFMNLKYPSQLKDSSGKYINSPMYLGAGAGKKNNPPRWLSGDLYSGRGDFAGMVRFFSID